ncbi:unnamed protein product [Closterium sp. Yama58-4]|nr:unnamed protein product [Closterium sp. Yama58-4]
MNFISACVLVFMPLTLLVATVPRSVSSAPAFRGGWGAESLLTQHGISRRGENRTSSEDVIRVSVRGRLEPFEFAFTGRPSASNSRSHLAACERVGAPTDYFERSYPGGWFTWYGPILDSRVEASDLPALVSSRERTHVPAFITAYAIASPRPLVYFSILWQPNSKSHGWVVVELERRGQSTANILAALLSLALLAAALPRHVSSSPAFRGGFGADFHLAAADAPFRDENLPRRNLSDGGTVTARVTPLVFSSHGNYSAPSRLRIRKFRTSAPTERVPSEINGAEPSYFERKYPGGWFSAGPILDSRVESSDLPALLSSRTRSHVPAFVSAYAVASPRPLVFFSILWQPNSKSLGWVMVFNLNGQQLQDALHHYISSGYKPSQVESYYVADHHGLYYAAIFLADVAWPAGSSTRVEAVFGVPHDASYCCGPSSRWLQLQRQGYTPLSVSFTEDPSSQKVYVADLWNDAPSRGGWQGGVAKTQAQLQQALSQLLPPLVPTFLKAYTVGYQVFYAYIARASPSSPPRSTLTTDVSRSAFELLARSLKQPPLLVSSYGPMDGGAGESDAPGSGERYAALWQTDGDQVNHFAREGYYPSQVRSGALRGAQGCSGVLSPLYAHSVAPIELRRIYSVTHLSGELLLHGGEDRPSLTTAAHPCRPVQMESFYATTPEYTGLYCGGIFHADPAWDEGKRTRVEAVYGVPYNASYCCVPSSRWQQLAQQPLQGLALGDWQGGVGMTLAQLQQALSQLPPSLVPTFLKAYTVGNEVFYAYIARASPSTHLNFTLTTNVSRSDFELLASSRELPPLFVSTYGPMDGADYGTDAPGAQRPDSWGFATSQMLRLAVVTFVLLSSSLLTRTQSVCNRQAVVYVTETGTATGCCGTAQRPCGSLDLALTNANLKGATILLVNGTIPISFSALSAPLALGGYSLTIAAGSLSSPSPTPPGKITSKPLINCKNGPCLSAVCASNGGAGGAAPAVPCAQASVTIQGVAVMSGLNRVAGGGCLEAANQKVTLTSVDFASCIAYLNGGAVSVSSSKDVTMTGVTVFDSKVTQGGIDGGGGGIAIFSSKATLSGLDIQSCHADESVGGGIAIYSTTLSLSSSSISECSSRFLGGGLASSSSKVTLKSVQITSTNGSSGGCLSDASSQSLSVQTSTFFGCFAASSRDYAPYSDDPSYGGGFFLNGTVSTVVLDSTIDSTTSVYGGGGIYAMGTSSISIQRSTITRCTNYMESGTGIGVDCWNLETITGSVELIDSNILDNTGYSEVNLGVGVYLSDVNAVVRGCNISGNNGLMTEGLKAQGGGISTNVYSKTDVTFELSNSTVSSNSAYMGGGLYIASPAVTITNVTFGYNYAVASGGGVYWLDGGSMAKSRVESNVGDMGGGGMAVNTINPITVDDCDFVANEATTGEGGGVLITEGEATDVTISNSRFSQNKAMAARGGGVFHSGTALSLLFTSFQSNSAAKGVTSSSFSLNHADLAGGAVYAAMTGEARITDCQLSQNDATTGGGVALEEYSVLDMQRSVCDGNKAISGGGCLALIDSTSEGNSADGGGGFVWAEMDSQVNASGTTFRNNSARFYGGVIYAVHSASVALTGSKLIANSADLGGAALIEGRAVLSSFNSTSTLAGNTGSSGGAIFSDALATVSINGCDFTSNSASKGAGALATGNSSLSVFLSNFTSNAASFGGGGLFYEGNSQGSILNCSFVGNDAKKGGAAVYVDRELLRKNPLGEMTDSSSGNGTGDGSSSGGSGSSSSGGGSGSGDSGSAGGSSEPSLPPAVALSNKLTCTNVVFEGNAAVPSQGVAFFDTSFWPGVRITCADADSTKRDTIGTPPTSFSLMWEKNVMEGGNATDTSQPFTVMGDTQTPIVNITVTILDAYGNVATDDFSSIIAIQPDPRISGLLRATALHGRAVLPPVSLVLPPEEAANFTLPITVSSPTDAYPPITRELEFGLCDPGSYFSPDDLACLPCEVGFKCPAGQGSVVCEDGTFSFLPAASECVTCANTVTIFGDNAMDCSNGTCTIAADFWLDPGSVDSDNPAVYYCDVSNGCAGFEYASPNDTQCAEGYNQNRLCSMCSEGYYSVIGTCYQCIPWMETLFWFFFVLVILLWVATAIFSDRFHSVSMMNSELQILAVLGSVDLQFPDWARKVVELSTLSLFSVDILGPDCKVSFPFTSRWALTMIVAAVGLAAYALLFAVQGTLRRFFPSPAHSQSHGHAGGKGGEKGGEVGGDKPSANPPAPLEDIYIHGAANWLDVCYLPVTVRCFQAFSKSTYDEVVMTFSPTDLWSSSARITLFALAIAVTIVFVAGAPIYYALTMLYGKKQKLLDTRAFRARWGWMVTRYEYRYFYWHLMLFARRILVAALFVFLIDSPPVQMTVLFPVQVILIGLQLAASPFVASTHDAFAAILIVAEMIFIIATMGFNFVQLETLPKIGFALVIVAFCVPTLIVFSYELINHLLVWKLHGAAKSLWALDDEGEGGEGGDGATGKPGAGATSNKPPKHVREGAVEVSPSDVLDWFRPHIAAIILLPGREEERRLLMKDLNKSQRFAALHQIVLGAAVGRRPVARVPFDARDVPAIWTTSGGVVIAGMGAVPTPSGAGGGGVGGQESEGRDIAAGGALSFRYGVGSTSFYGGAGGGPGGASTRVHDILASSRFISKAMRENAKTDRPALVRSKNISIKNLRPPKPPQPLPQDLWPPPLEECATWAHVIGRQQAAQMERDAALAEGREEEEEEEEDEGTKEEMAGAPAGYANGGSEKPNGAAAGGAVNGGDTNGEGEEDEEDEEEEEEEEEGEYLEAWLDSMGISLAFQQSFSQLTLVEKKRKPQSLRRLLTSVKLPDILGWLSSPLCTTADRALFVRLLAAVRAATVEDAGGPRWSKCLVVAFQGKANTTRKVAAASKDYLAEASEHTLAEASQEDSPYGYGV